MGYITLSGILSELCPFNDLEIYKFSEFSFKFKLQQQVLSNFTHIFTGTRPTSWLREHNSVDLLSELWPFIDIET